MSEALVHINSAVSAKLIDLIIGLLTDTIIVSKKSVFKKVYPMKKGSKNLIKTQKKPPSNPKRAFRSFTYQVHNDLKKALL